jgi:hypothetical protein
LRPLIISCTSYPGALRLIAAKGLTARPPTCRTRQKRAAEKLFGAPPARQSREDATAKVLSPTDEGQQLLGTTTPVMRNVDRGLLAVLRTVQRKPFLAPLQAIVRNLEAAR